MNNLLSYIPLLISIVLAFTGIPVFIQLYKATQSLYLSIFLTIIYEIVIILGSFLSKVWQKLEGKWVDRVADWVDQIVVSIFSGYRWIYLEYVVYQNRGFDVRGLSTQGPYSLELNQIFVQPNLVPISYAQANSKNPIGLHPEFDDLKRQTIWDYLRMRLPTRSFVIIGPPGSGKTTLLKSIALTLSSNSLRRKIGAPRLIPILLLLRDNEKSIKNDPTILLPQLIREQLATRLNSPPPEGWLEKQLEQGKCLVMFDGLDEVANSRTRQLVSDWVDDCKAIYEKNCFIVTSRPHGYESNPLRNVSLLQMAPLDGSQIEHFVYNWYLANEIISSQKDDPGVRQVASKGAKDLLLRIKSNKYLAELSINPLLLTMIVTVHRYKSSLPGRRVELYAEICDAFLGKLQQARGLTIDMTPIKKRNILCKLAYEMTEQNIRAINLLDAQKIIAEPLSKVDPHIKPENFLREVENSSGLLTEYENNEYRFVHISFQEYLTSLYIFNAKIETELLKQINNVRWHETILLYCAQTDASQIVAACLDTLNVTTLNLAIRCVAEAQEIRPDVRTDFHNVILASLNSSESEIRILASKEIGILTSLPLYYDAFSFFKAAGFDCQSLDPEYKSALRCKPNSPEWESEMWKERLRGSLYVQISVNHILNRDDIVNIYKSAQLVVENPTVIIIVVNQALSISGWDEINALRFGNGVHIVPIDDIIIQRGRETNRERDELETQLNRSMGRQDYYDVRDATADRRNFFGRHELATEVIETLNQNLHLALLGLRKMGKSSFLQYLRDQVPFLVSYIDLQNGCLDSKGRLSDAIYARILDGWQASIKVKIPDFDWIRPELLGEPSIDFAEATRELLKQLALKDKMPRLGVFLDEFDLSLPKIYRGTVAKFGEEQVRVDPVSLDKYLVFARTLRGLIEETKQLSLVVAGVDPRFTRTIYWDDNVQNPFYLFFRVTYLGPLTIDYCTDMIRNIGKQMSLPYDDDALSFVANVTGGHPYLARQLCSLAYKRRDANQTRNVTLREMQSAAEIFTSHPDYNDSLEGIWQEALMPIMGSDSLLNKKILLYLARHKSANVTDVTSYFKNIDCNNSIIELTSRHILNDAGGLLTIRFELFRRWIEKYHVG